MGLLDKLSSSGIKIEGSNNNVINGNDNTINNSFFEAAKTITSTLANVVNALGKAMPEEDTYLSVPDFSVEHKKNYNNVRIYRLIMDEYGLFTGKLAVVYATLDAEGTDITFNTLNNVRLQYTKVRHSYMLAHPDLTVIEVVRMYADKIFEDVEQRLLTNVISSANLVAPIESVQLSIQVVMIDAFVKCKILENPHQDATT